jgi:DNA-binding MarR family transcriptional regulator
MNEHPRATIPSTAGYSTSVADRAARLNVALKRQTELYARTAFDISIVDARLILMLGMFAPTTVNNLAARSDVDRTQISRSMRMLGERGWVSKKPGPVDRREAILQLTAKGRKTHDRLVAELYRRNEDLIDGLDPQRLAVFFEIADQLIQRARAQLDGPPGDA